ncbi:hypothetical protein ATPR_2371 [Acetobacter tropicalis NBRC 101654]|uniref:Uncharacterized protein n=1 Tax=Acetobacter tropicalis NBRC 101654 TaxID=749388 RepID=F7VG72_9PROT|nr:hypothetical protein ATPR_2371 [Acetobacter tropicalis NBRC 101654]
MHNLRGSGRAGAVFLTPAAEKRPFVHGFSRKGEVKGTLRRGCAFMYGTHISQPCFAEL